MVDTEELKDQIGILDVLEEIGARYEYRASAAQIRVFCPFCADAMSEHPSASANRVQELYYCFQCGVGGDIIKIAQEHLGTTSFTEAAEWLTRTFIT